MFAPPTIFDVIRVILFFVSPIIFLEGVLLLLLTVDRYNRLEKALNKEIGGLRKHVIPALETDIYAFHNWLLKRSVAVGVICIVYSLTIFLLLKK